MADTKLFTRLKRLFSTDVIIRNDGNNQLKTFDINQVQQAGQIATNSIFNRLSYSVYTNNATSIYGYQKGMNYQTLRSQLYSEYDAMDTDSIIASALDIVADEATRKSDMGEILQIKSSDEDIQNSLYNLFYEVLGVQHNLWSWIRAMCKYGDFFLKLDIAEKYGIYNAIPYSAFFVERQERYNPSNPNAVRFRFDPDGGASHNSGYYSAPTTQMSNSPGIFFDNYEIIHFRLLTDTNYLPYGRSYLEPARKLYKQYSLMEDAMLIHRVMRAPEKRMFYINVGGIAPDDVDGFMEKIVSKMKRTPYVDDETGEYNLKFNMQNINEDFYIPVRGNDTSTRIENLGGLNWDGINDVEYLQKKLFAALKIPRAFLGYDENTEGKATLAAEDMRFARTIERVQNIFLPELYKMAIIHLYTQGYRNAELNNFELDLTTPSIIYDREKVELLTSKVDLAVSILDNKLFPSDWVYENLFDYSEDQYREYRDLILSDAEREFRREQIANEGNDPKKTGKSYGTPHELASLYGKGRYKNASVPQGYDEDLDLGRPQETLSDYDKQDSVLGRDRLGRQGMKNDINEPEKLEFNNVSEFKKSITQNIINKLNLVDDSPTGRKCRLYENKGEDLDNLDLDFSGSFLNLTE